MRRRQAIVIEFQERIKQLRKEIEKQQVKQEEQIDYFDRIIQGHQDDIDFFTVLLREFGLNVEVEIEDEDTVEEETEEVRAEVETRLIASERSPPKLTRDQYREQKDKARAWHIDRQREKDEKERKRKSK
jgi:hypothetical protein